MTRQQRLGRKEYVMSDEVKELLARNKAYKTTLDYCNETCDDIDTLFDDAIINLHNVLNNVSINTGQYNQINVLLSNLNVRVKEQGTRKLRQAFVDYVLEQQRGKDMSNNIAKLKLLIIKHETLENILIKSGNTYDVVSCSVVDFDAEEGKYLFYVEGYSCTFDIDDIEDWCYAKDCF